MTPTQIDQAASLVMDCGAVQVDRDHKDAGEFANLAENAGDFHQRRHWHTAEAHALLAAITHYEERHRLTPTPWTTAERLAIAARIAARASDEHDEPETCPGCGEPRDETAESTWQQWQCTGCGSWNDRPAEEAEELCPKPQHA